MELYEVLRRPLITEKNTLVSVYNKYTFEVAPDANKPMIRRAVETLFKVDVTKVNVSTVHGKLRRVGKSQGMTRDWKKAVVTIKEGQRIEAFGSA
jgi:large subunit ribosomal protein L23